MRHKKPYAKLISILLAVLMVLAEVPPAIFANNLKTGGMSEVYLNGNAGSGGDGSLEYPVQTFAEAKSLLAKDGTIYISGTVVVSTDESWDLSGMGTAKILRAQGFQNILVNVKSGELTLSNIILDGNKNNVSNVFPVITLVTGKVILNAGAIIRNNNNSSIYANTGSAGPSFRLGAEVIMNEGSEVSGNNSDNGGGIQLAYDAQLSLKGGVISGNSVANKGGGVYAGISSKIVMSGGSISNNQSAATGGGVYLEIGHLAADNTQDQSSAYFEFSGGKISENTATGDGGGVYLLAPFMTDGPTFKMTGGSITGNISGNKGGGIAAMGGSYNKKVLTVIYGGNISGNKAVTGGGIYLGGYGQLALRDCSITGNSAQDGGGIYHIGSLLQLQDVVRVTGNTITNSTKLNNLHLDGISSANKMINIANGVTNDAFKGEIGISSKRIPGKGASFSIVQGVGGHLITSAEAALFASDDNDYVTELNEDGKVYFKLAPPENIYLSQDGDDSNDGTSADNAVKSFEKAFELVRAKGTIWLSSVIEVTDEQTWGTADKTGITVKRTSQSKGAMFIINAGGKVTMKNITFDGAIRDADGKALSNQSGQVVASVRGELIMDTGSIVQNNFSATHGGAISVYGTMVLKDDAIIRNNKTIPGKGGGIFGATGSTITVNDSASITGNNGGNGGGIYSEGEVNINGGNIVNNIAPYNGGGVESNNTGSLKISGGIISNNQAGENGGGIYCSGSGSQISNAVIKNNSAERYGGGIYYGSETVNTDTYSIGDSTLLENTANGNGNPAMGKGNNIYVYDNPLLVEGNALLGGGVFLYFDNSTSKLIFDKAPQGVSLEGVKAGGLNPIAGTVVAEGNAYTLTQNDLTKFTYDNEGFTFQLDTDKNQIKMREVFTVTFNVNGGDGEYVDQKISSGDKAVKPEAPTKAGYTFDGWYDGDKLFDFDSMPITANIALKAKWTDKTAPLAKIMLGENHWDKLLNTITYQIFFKDIQAVTINATDTGSGVKSVEYYIANDKVEDISKIVWTPYLDIFSIQPNNEYVIYARISDNAGNVSVINSDGLVFDDIAPTITGADNHGVYCISRELTITDKYLDTVTIDGIKATIIEGKVTVLGKANAQKIVAKDKSGNSSIITITVHKSHTLSGWKSDDTNHWKECKNTGCTHKTQNIVHSWNAGKITTPATITQKGVKTYTCTVCSKTKTEIIPMLTTKNMLVEKSTGIKIVYEDGSLFDSSIVLKVTSKPQAEMDKFKKSISKVVPGLTLSGLYDIKLLKDGVAIQPNGKIKVSIPLTDAMKSMTDLQVIYIDNKGNVTIIPSEVKDDIITFITDHFSNYGVIGKAKSTGPSDNTKTPQTGDSSSLLLFTFMMCISGFVLIAQGKKGKVFKRFK